MIYMAVLELSTFLRFFIIRRSRCKEQSNSRGVYYVELRVDLPRKVFKNNT